MAQNLRTLLTLQYSFGNDFHKCHFILPTFTFSDYHWKFLSSGITRFPNTMSYYFVPFSKKGFIISQPNQSSNLEIPTTSAVNMKCPTKATYTHLSIQYITYLYICIHLYICTPSSSYFNVVCSRGKMLSSICKYIN